MIIFCNARGAVEFTVPSQVTQGSTLKDGLYLIMPVNGFWNSVTVRFQLSNGYKTQAYPMTEISAPESLTTLHSSAKDWGVWVFDNSSLLPTSTAGTTTMTFTITNNNEVVTVTSEFIVNAGVIGVPSTTTPTENQWQTFLEQYNRLASIVASNPVVKVLPILESVNSEGEEVSADVNLEIEKADGSKTVLNFTPATTFYAQGSFIGEFDFSNIVGVGSWEEKVVEGSEIYERIIDTNITFTDNPFVPVVLEGSNDDGWEVTTVESVEIVENTKVKIISSQPFNGKLICVNGTGAGERGLRGSLWYYGTQDPASTNGYLIYDKFLNTSSGDVFTVEENSSNTLEWTNVGNIKGNGISTIERQSVRQEGQYTITELIVNYTNGNSQSIEIYADNGTVLNYKGDWLSGGTYAENDVVKYVDNAYICVKAVSGSTVPPPEDITNWRIFFSGVGVDGVGIKFINTGVPYLNNGYTVTPLQIILSDNKVYDYNIEAKNGVDGVDGKSITEMKNLSLIPDEAFDNQIRVSFNNGTSTDFHVYATKGDPGVGVDDIIAGSPTTTGEYTKTPITFELSDRTNKTIDVQAKMGERGFSGYNITEIRDGTPYIVNNYTYTPLRFTLSNGQVLTAEVRAKNGIDGIDGIDGDSVNNNCIVYGVYTAFSIPKIGDTISIANLPKSRDLGKVAYDSTWVFIKFAFSNSDGDYTYYYCARIEYRGITNEGEIQELILIDGGSCVTDIRFNGTTLLVEHASGEVETLSLPKTVKSITQSADKQTLTITYTDRTTETITLPSGGGSGGGSKTFRQAYNEGINFNGKTVTFTNILVNEIYTANYWAITFGNNYGVYGYAYCSSNDIKILNPYAVGVEFNVYDYQLPQTYTFRDGSEDIGTDCTISGFYWGSTEPNTSNGVLDVSGMESITAQEFDNRIGIEFTIDN